MQTHVRPADNLKLKQTVQLLCTTGIRQPLKMERVKIWLKQFSEGPEKTLALLILRHLIYRTTAQIESALAQALRRAALHFVPAGQDRENLDWREILAGKSEGLYFIFGPPAHENTQPGKSGELIARLLKSLFPIEKQQVQYPDTVTVLDKSDRYLLIDDGTFTGLQLSTFIEQRGQFMKTANQTGIVLAMAHETALANLAKAYPGIPVYFGEKITVQDGLPILSKQWDSNGQWPYVEATPIDVYLDVVNTKGKFTQNSPLGFGGMGLLVAYEHGIPDDSLQLLWDKSGTWTPLFDR